MPVVELVAVGVRDHVVGRTRHVAELRDTRGLVGHAGERLRTLRDGALPRSSRPSPGSRRTSAYGERDASGERRLQTRARALRGTAGGRAGRRDMRLTEAYDAFLVDLDGVVWRGEEP